MSTSVMVTLLAEGFVLSVQIFFWTLLGSLPLGILVALGRMTSFKPLAWLMGFFISLLRGTPLMLQLLAVFFGPYYLFGMELSPEWKITGCILAFIINYSAYFAEIYRSGIQSIPRGQYEAAEVLGYSKLQTFMRIVLPQVFKRIMPAMGNEVITLVKDTSLAFVLGVGELMSVAKSIAASQVSMEPYIIAAAMYWVFCIVLELSMNKIEKKMSYYHD